MLKDTLRPLANSFLQSKDLQKRVEASIFIPKQVHIIIAVCPAFKVGSVT